jgi:hypothetical protein
MRYALLQDKADRVLQQLDDSRHLWFYDIPASDLEEYGYSGPDLVLNMLHRWAKHYEKRFGTATGHT